MKFQTAVSSDNLEKDNKHHVTWLLTGGNGLCPPVGTGPHQAGYSSPDVGVIVNSVSHFISVHFFAFLLNGITHLWLP